MPGIFLGLVSRPAGRIVSLVLMFLQLLICAYAAVKGVLMLPEAAPGDRIPLVIGFYSFFTLVAVRGILFFLPARK